MSQPLIKLLLAGLSALVIAAAALTISPSSHDFGEVPVLGVSPQEFVVTAPRADTLRFAFTGPDASDFVVLDNLPEFIASGCWVSGPAQARCNVDVLFRPGSVGPKRATLVVTSLSGDRVTAALKGMGVRMICTHTVVPCNYALHYSGVVSWSDLSGHVNVDVVKGVASCNAANAGEIISGPGIIGVEFGESEDEPSPFYRITVACPTRYPPEPARPAELGHGEFGSYKQPLGMKVEEANVRPPRLKGTSEDGEVSWNLCPHGRYVPAVRQGPRATAGPHDPCPAPARRAP